MSGGLFITLSLVGIISFEIYSKNLQRAGEQRLAGKIAEWSKIILFTPAYVPTGLQQLDETTDRINNEFLYTQYYYPPLYKTFDHVQIVQSIARKSFEEYYRGYHREYAEKWKEEKTSIDNLKTIVWIDEREPPDQLVEVFLLKMA